MRQFIISCLMVLSVIMGMSSSLAVLDSKGKDFFLTFNSNTATGLGNIQLFISSETQAAGTVQVEGLSFVEDFVVAPGDSVKIDIPKSAQQHITNSVGNLAVRVTANQEVKVYGLNQSRFTTDAFLGLPIDVLGVDYIILGYQNRLGLNTAYPPEFSIVAPYDNTVVTIVPSVTTGSRTAGEPYSISLKTGETYSLKGPNDFTGTTINTDKPVGVTSSVGCTDVPSTNRFCDHIVEMLPPVSTWGTSYLTIPLATRLKGDFFRFLASEDNTVITVNGQQETTLNRGEFHEMVITERAEVVGDKPIMVMQYSASSNFDGVNSDPFMMLVPPAGQYLTDYTFETLPSSLGFQNGFVNVVVTTADISSVILDGNTVDASLFEVIGQSEFSGAQIQLDEGVHNITAAVPLGISVYGFGAFDSYGYPGGMAFERINPGGDQYAPFVKLMSMGNVIEGIAGDFEDLNLNGLIDLGEDLNGNNILDRRTEDLNGNNQLDVGEDTNGNGLLDRDTGIFRIKLDSGAQNLVLSLANFVPGSLQTNFTINVVDASLPASGVLVVTDGAGNEARQPIDINNASTFQNVRVISTLSGNDIELDQGSFSQTPDRIQAVADGTEIEWRFAQFEIDQMEDLGYEVVLKNPVAGETRLVTQSLLLIYLDANGDEVRRELGEQSVEVSPSIFTVQVTTDKPQYTANETVLITPQIGNLSAFDAATDVRLLIQTESGELVRDLGVMADFGVAANGSRVITGVSFDTLNTLAGNYSVIAELLDDSGKIMLSDEAPFEIVDNVTTTVSLRTTTDKSTYHTSDTIEISDLVRNLSVNRIIQAPELDVQVTDPNGVVIFERRQPLSDLTPSASQMRIDSYAYTGNAVGDYQVQGQVFDDQGQLLASDAVSVQIISNLAIDLIGKVTTATPVVNVGEAVQCDFTVTNKGIEAIAGLELRHIVSEFDSQQSLQLDEYQTTLESNVTYVQTVNIETGEYQVGQYACILQANIDGQWQALDFATFELFKVSLQAEIGNQGRVLILLDDSNQCTDDPFGPRNAPDLVAQQQYLETLLDGAGWSYTITLNARDFIKELRTGGYSIYMLMSELAHIPHFVQKEVREAVYRGEGLIEAGKRLQPYSVINQAHGISHRGQEHRAQGISLTDSQLSNADNVSFTHRDRHVRVMANSAQIVAEYMQGQSSQSSHHRGHHYHGHRYFKQHHYRHCPPVQQTAPAITLNQFGLGKTVFMGFDLLVEAVSMGANDSIFSDLLLNSLGVVNPEPSLTTVGTDYPIVFTVNNLGVATEATLTLPIADTVSVVDAGNGVIDETAGHITWALDLSDGATIDIPLWVEMPEQTVTLTGTITTGDGANATEQATASIDLTPESVVAIEDVIAMAQGSRALKRVYYKLRHARWYLKHQRAEQALRSLLIATNHVAHIQRRYQNEDLTALRVNIGLLIKQTAKQVVVSRARHRCVMRGHWPGYHYPSHPKRCGHGHGHHHHSHGGHKHGR